MKIPFDGWLRQQPLDTESGSLFEEALRCYQAGAYRAALVFSYLGLLRSLASRLMNSRPQPNFPGELWKKIQRQIRDDSGWEAQTFDAVIRSKPSPIFLIDEDLRLQLQYWRGRRNDAAHAKNNEISHAHVEMLWFFIQSNLGRFVVNGGPVGLLEKFKRHFDPTFTAPGSDFSDLVRQISDSVPPSEYADFFSDLIPLFKCDFYDFQLSEEQGALVEHLERLGHPKVIEAFSAQLRQDPGLLLGTLIRKPTFVLNYSTDSLFIHELWHDLLPFGSSHPWQLTPSLGVFGVMLRTGLIEEHLREAVVLHVVGRIWETSSKHVYSEDLMSGLEPFGFWQAVRHHAFEKMDHIIWAAENLLLTIEYLWRHPIDWQVAATFCEFFPGEILDSDNDGYWWCKYVKLAFPEDLAWLKHYFEQNPDLFDEIVKVSEAHGLPVKFFQTYMNPQKGSVL